MGLQKRGGKWYYRFTLDGKLYKRSTGLAATARNRNAASELEHEHRQAILEGRRPTARVQVRLFSDAAEEFLNWAEQEHREHPNTWRRLRTSFATLRASFGETPVSLIDEGAIERYKAWRRESGVKEVTLRHDCHGLSKFFRYAVLQHWARGNPVRNVAMPSDAEAVRIHVVTSEEEKAYFGMAIGILHDVGRLMLNQGCRPMELLSLRCADVDLMNRVMKIRKGKTRAARRTLKLTDESLSILGRRLTGESPWVFPSRRGGHRRDINTAHNDVLDKLERTGKGVAFVIYDFRHTFASRLAARGVALTTLAAILGHASIRMVERYIHPSAADMGAVMSQYNEILLEQAKEESKGRRVS